MERPPGPPTLPGAGSPEVGVVIAAHDASPWIAATLRSVLDQTLGTWHCVVVDDGSRDGTAQVATEVAGDDPRFTLLARAQGGVSAARNTGLAALPASCRHVAFLDSDDTWLPDALAVLTGALDERPDAVGVSASAELMDEAGEPLAPGEHPAKLRERLVARGGRLLRLGPEEDTTFECLVTAGRIWPPAVVLLDRARVDAAGGFDESLRISEDWDLFLRLARGGPLRFLDRQVAWYRRRGGSLTADATDRVTYFNDLVRHKACTAPENTPAQRRAARRGWRTVQRHAAVLDGRAALAGLRRRRRSEVLRAGRTALPLLLGSLARIPRPPRLETSPARAAMVAVVQPVAGRRTARAGSGAAGGTVAGTRSVTRT